MRAKALGEAASASPVLIPITDAQPVSGLLQTTTGATSCYVLAHGAGAGMRHPFLTKVTDGLAERRIATLRYQFPYMEKGSPRPDSPAVAHQAVRASVAVATPLVSNLPLFAGGKSFGGRMTSQAQAESPLPGVRGLIFLGFPLHPPGKPSDERAKHLFEIHIPMLFLQGDRDEFAKLNLLQSLMDQLDSRATLKLFPSADHSFHVPARTGKKDAEVMAQVLDEIKEWTHAVLQRVPSGAAKG
jgi:predicted alpha/beta-hydrolase family hydrolase